MEEGDRPRKGTLPMTADQFLEYIKDYRIPPTAPSWCDEGGWNYASDILSFRIGARGECTKRGMWAIVTEVLARDLAAYIGDLQVLEIMSGVGWLAKALSDVQMDILATDDYSWRADIHANARFLFEVEQLDCVDAVEKYPNSEILLVSWPHMNNSHLVKAMNAWGTDRPVIYIGEGPEGCCAQEDFFEIFGIDESIAIPLMSWTGIHDHVYVGHVHLKEKT